MHVNSLLFDVYPHPIFRADITLVFAALERYHTLYNFCIVERAPLYAMGDDRQDFGYSRTVSYTNSHHLNLICQKWGSVNQKVMPFCLANILVTVVLVALLEYGIDLTIDEFGHEFMSVLVAFLVINKLSFTLGLYYELQGYLSKMNQSAVELVQLACSYTADRHQEPYKEWRINISLQTLTLLKATVFVVYKGGEENVWEIPELADNQPVLFMDESFRRSFTNNSQATNKLHGGDIRKSKVPKELYLWGYQLKSDKNLRVPIRVAQRLRQAITAHKQLPNDSIDSIQERVLLDCVKEFMDSYHGVRKYLTCPLPLPLVQLGRMFVIFYVFTLPFALLSPNLNLKYPQMIALIFLMTYGFMGIELLFVEIDNPFAEDPNDLPLTEEARAAGEDVILSLWHLDGRQAAEQLKAQFSTSYFANGYSETATESDPLV